MSTDQVKAAVLAYMLEHFPAAKWASIQIDSDSIIIPPETLVVIRPESPEPAGQWRGQQARTA